MDFIKFLGTAGARFVMIKQLRSSGGIWVSLDDTNILIDPGPGSLIRCLSSKPRLDPKNLDGIILTHRHIDHSNDINLMIEAMTDGGFKKKGKVFAPKDALEDEPVIFRYAREQVEEIIELHEGKEYSIKNLRFDTPVKHLHGVETYGINIYGKGITISLISDTKYFDGLESFYKGDILILNVIRLEPRDDILHLSLKDAEKISGEYLAEHYLTKNKACAGCPIVCGRVTKVESGSFKSEGEGPEYETIWSLGAMCGINDMEAIIKAHHLCDFFGLDGIATGSTIACAMELFEKGYIKKDEVGFDLVFGNGEAMVKAVELIGKREGFGDKMALGSYRLAESYGHPELSMSVKKQEFPAYDPRAIKGIGLEYATSNRGACHVRGYTIAAEVLAPEPVDRLSYDGKAELAILFQNFTAVVDSSGTCLFTTFGMELSDFANLLKSATGFDYDEKSALLAGERIWNLERLWNIEVGYTKDDDTLPERLLKEPIKTGPSKGEVTDISKMLPEYYRLRGWDENGIPTDTKKKELGISQ